jgi:drug/metabolite transporter (DMT)-like permease
VLYLVWGSTFLGIRVAVETIPPLAMPAIRFLLSGAVLLLASGRSLRGATLRQWRNAAAIGSLFFFGNHALVSTAASRMPSGLVSLIIATEVPVIAVLSSLLPPRQPLTRRGLLGAAIGLTGVASLFVGSGSEASRSLLFPALLVLGASLSWSSGVVLSQRLEAPANPILRAGMQMTCGGILLAVASVVRGEPARLASGAVSQRSLVALAYLVVFGSVLAFACFTWLIARVRADTVATHVFVNPLVAVALGAWLGGERLLPAHLVAGLLILASVVIITAGQPRPARQASAPLEPANEEGERRLAS